MPGRITPVVPFPHVLTMPRRLGPRLIDNAIKFSHRGEVVRISLELQDDREKRFVVIRVVDQGVGIKDTSKIFEAFSQEQGNITKTNSVGLGECNREDVYYPLVSLSQYELEVR